MRTFTDKTGQQWTLAVNCDAIDRVRDQVGIDLDQPYEGDPPPLQKLGVQVSPLVKTIFAIVSPQAEALKVDRGSFEVRIRGAGFDALRESFFQEWADFFRDFQIEPLELAIRKQQEIFQTGSALLMKKMRDVAVTPESIEREFDRQAGSAATNSPESAVSTPADTPGAS